MVIKGGREGESCKCSETIEMSMIGSVSQPIIRHAKDVWRGGVVVVV